MLIVLKLITNNMQNSMLSLADTNLKLLKQKHLKSALKESFYLVNLKVFTKSNPKISLQMQFAKPP